MNKKMRIPGLIAVCLFVLMAVSACIEPAADLMGTGDLAQKAYEKQYLDYFDTVSSITLYANSQAEFDAYAAVFEDTICRYHELCDIYENYPDINNAKSINDQAGVLPVRVDEDLYNLLKYACEMGEFTGWRVNIAMGSVLSVWHSYRELALADPSQAALPDEIELEQAAEFTDAKAIVFNDDQQTVFLPDKHMSLDLGAVAKGYAADRAAAALKNAGVTNGLISIGGNVQTIGKRGDGKPWRVGVQNPTPQSDMSYLAVAELDDQCLVTSGDYQRYYEVDGKRYHHIIDPDTLMPSDRYHSVTVMSKDGALADVLSTALFNMDLEDGLDMVAGLDGTEAMWIDMDGNIQRSPGFMAELVE